jgi:hypothetical protein
MNIGSGHHGNHDDALTPEERALADRRARLGPQGEPSPALDARILAAARAATSAPVATATAHRSPRRRQRRWPVAFGAAATLVIVGGLAWQLRPVDDLQVDYSEAPRAVSGPSADAAPASRPAQQAVVALPPSPAAEVAPAAADSAAPASASPAPIPAKPPEPDAATERFAEAPSGAGAQPAPKAFTTKPPAPAEPPVVFDEPSPMDTPSPPGEPRHLAPPAPPAPSPPAAPPAPAPAARAAVAFPQEPASGNAPATRSVVEAENKARAQRAKTLETTARRIPSAQVASGAVAQPARPADTAAAADASALDRIEVTGARIEDEEDQADVGYASDQPLDDQPPASVDSPQVRQAWLQRVRQLVAEGKPDAARDSLREYQRRYPKATLPDDLRALLDE